MKQEVVVTADKVKRWHRLGKMLRLSLLIVLLLLIIAYIVLKVLFQDSNFIISLKSNDDLEAGLAIYESLYDRTPKRVLKAKSLQFMDNISEKWIPEDVDSEYDGSHNGDNYIAYTFYVENQSDSVFDYWYSVIQDDVVKNVDEAIRIKIYVNGEATTYAKGNSINREAERGTVKFRNDEDGTIVLAERANSEPGNIDRITVVIWIEGNDPECVDAILGGEMLMHMSITEEHTQLD